MDDPLHVNQGTTDILPRVDGKTGEKFGCNNTSEVWEDARR